MDLDPPLHPATNREEEEAVTVADLNDPLRPVSVDGGCRGFGGVGRGRGFGGVGRGRVAGRGRGFGGDGGGHGSGGDGRGRGFGGASKDRGFSSVGCRDGRSSGGCKSQDSGGTGRGSIFKNNKSPTKAPEKLKKDADLTFTKKSKKLKMVEGSSNIMSLTAEKIPTEDFEDTEKHGQVKVKRCRSYWPENFEHGVSEEVLQFHKEYGPDASDEKAIEKLKLFWGKGHIMMELRDEGEYREYHCTLCPWSTSRYFHASNHFDSKNHLKQLKRVQFSMRPDAKQWPFNDSLRFFNSTLHDDEVLRDEVMIPLHCGDYELNSYIIGVGKIGIRFQDVGDGMLGVRRIWCEWLGYVDNPRDSEFCQFGLLTFVYPSSACPLRVIDAGVTNLIKKTNADKVVKGKEKQKRKTKKNALPHKKFLKCSVCKQELLEGKHAATLINIEDKSLLCKPGVRDIFDIGHVSCLVNWFLACEFQKLANMIPTFFCPPCMGTGQEEGSITYQHRNYVLNTLPAGKAWENDFEKLDNNSTALTPEHPGEYKEFLRPWKYLKFYKGVSLKKIRTDEKYSAGEHVEGSSDFVGHANSDQRYSDGEHAEGSSDFIGRSNSDEKYSAGEHAEGSSDFVGHANSDQRYSDGEHAEGFSDFIAHSNFGK